MHARFAFFPVALLTAACLYAPVAMAEEEEAQEATELASPTLHGKLALSIADAVAMGLKNNLDLEVQRFAPVIAYQDAEGAWGAFDPEAFAEFGYEEETTPNAFVLAQTFRLREETTDGVGGFRGLLPYLGATYEVSLSGERRLTNSQVQALSPELRSRVTVGATVPLLKDLIWNEPLTRIKTTQSLYQGTREEFRTRVMNTVNEIERAYWDLIATEESQHVAEKSLETARALHDQTETQYEVGVVSKVEVIEADAGVAEREVNLIRAENAYRTGQDRLIDLVMGIGLTAGSRLEIEPTDRPED